MSELSYWVWLIPGLPLLAAALIAFLGEAVLRKYSHAPCVIAIGQRRAKREGPTLAPASGGNA